MPLLPPNRNYQGVLLPNATAPKYDRAFAQGNRVFHSRENLVLHPQNGTPDPTFDPETAFTYLGAFRIPVMGEPSGGQLLSIINMDAIAIDTNTNTLFAGKHNSLVQLSIPELSMSDVAQELNPAQKLQPFTTYLPKLANQDDSDGNPNDRLGWLKVINGKLYIHGHNYYDAGPTNQHNMMVIDNPYDLANTTATGWISTGAGDRGAGYAMDIPPSKRDSFGGFTHFMGVGYDLSVVSRASSGHSLTGINLDSLGQINPVDTQTFVHYPIDHPVEGCSGYNHLVRDHYAGLIKPDGMDWVDYLDIDPSQRVNELESQPRPDISLYQNLILFAGKFPLGFIPDGSNSVVYIGHQAMMRYGGVYKSRDLEHSRAGRSQGQSPISGTDFDNLIWTMNLNDIANASNTYDPKYNYCGRFQGDRWLQKNPSKNNSIWGGLIMGGDYDSVSKKLYVLHNNIPMDGDQFTNGMVVAVYQVGGV